MRIGRLFLGIARTNEKDRVVVASWSYVTGYWRWALYRSPWRSWRVKLSGSYPYPETKTWLQRFSPMGRLGHPFGMYVCIPLLGVFSLSTQPPLPAMKKWGRA